ncbi:MAG TPA: hypothetical protein VIL18_00160 [Longimicrobiales bacterium]
MATRSSAAILGLIALWPGGVFDGGNVLEVGGAPEPAAVFAAQDTARPVRVVIENRSYSALQILIRDEQGRERRLGQAPPEFTNTLFITPPLPAGPVRLIARLAGESDDLYVSAPTRLEGGTRIRWRLPENVLER